ncbi:hypothetical protein PC119_g10152 [Phytophthora cactorum]|uniref:Transposase Tc1-like domain-containing protein n=1 Tax=Phytophthora cactorum TaxID=29920 RepID=A0A8T1DFQ5_9STRA|nr:hypothetical protein PC114_g10749 [Phytophthora cactorum]KAG2940397.1 hypothetical protein PC117_g10547 [Phytophthora cactorum]KAG3019878.1 hypothetical protein PC119_g10152 [Phytophthora cactorum]KAG3021231.1 hypothetical protein PC120_g8806 [Phytophthora cactorum]KAG3169673.1 hypothetical protein C6341_g11002 [Phytophthora cactorum]
MSRRSGRPRITDLHHDRRIVREVEKNRFVSAAVLAAQVSKEIGRPVSSDVVRDRIHEAGLHGRSARKKPYLSPKHHRLRRIYAKSFDKMTHHFWKRVSLVMRPRLSCMERPDEYPYGGGLTRHLMLSVLCLRLSPAGF